MKLLFDQNLSFKLCTLLSDLFPDSKPVRELGLDRSDDRVVWQHAKDNATRLQGWLRACSARATDSAISRRTSGLRSTSVTPAACARSLSCVPL